MDDFGIRIPSETLKTIFLPYHDKSLLPNSGGTLEQDPDCMEAISTMSLLVALWIQYYQDDRKDFEDLDALEDIN